MKDRQQLNQKMMEVQQKTIWDNSRRGMNHQPTGGKAQSRGDFVEIELESEFIKRWGEEHSVLPQGHHPTSSKQQNILTQIWWEEP